MSYGEGLSASDVALLNNSCGRNNSYDGFGEGNGAWWIVLFLIFALGGWGRGFGNGFGGGFGSSSGGVADGYVLASDFAQVDRKLDTLSNGICDSTFALNNTMTNGFANVQNTLCQGFSGVNQAIVQNGYETRLGVQNLNSQLANCCCDLRQQISDTSCATQRGLDGINYNMAMNTNSIQQTLSNNTRDIIESNNANYRALHDEIVANRIEDKNAQIQAQQNEINSLRLAASQERQNSYLIDQLKPCPIPAYITCNPYQSYGFTYANNGCGCATGCGC